MHHLCVASNPKTTLTHKRWACALHMPNSTAAISLGYHQKMILAINNKSTKVNYNVNLNIMEYDNTNGNCELHCISNHKTIATGKLDKDGNKQVAIIQDKDQQESRDNCLDVRACWCYANGNECD